MALLELNGQQSSAHLQKKKKKKKKYVSQFISQLIAEKVG